MADVIFFGVGSETSGIQQRLLPLIVFVHETYLEQI
jgi:hypothetical protein